jgi:hypothetical protein
VYIYIYGRGGYKIETQLKKEKICLPMCVDLRNSTHSRNNIYIYIYIYLLASQVKNIYVQLILMMEMQILSKHYIIASYGPY